MFSDRALGRRYQNNIIEQERETCLTQLWEVEVLDLRKKRARICSCSGASRQRINSFLFYMGIALPRAPVFEYNLSPHRHEATMVTVESTHFRTIRLVPHPTEDNHKSEIQ
ncbi:hypothetical protein Q1695_013174 [Nippostrongylus brasiliensis]|nr:hypothetical protein Q1695_013174 [Nippostrongylus brasiliensis]